MKFLNFKLSLMASLVTVAALAAWTEAVSADSAVQWAGGSTATAATEHGIVPSRDLRWSKPKTTKKAPAVTTADVEPTEPTRIQQVQYKVAQTLQPNEVPKPPTGATLVPAGSDPVIPPQITRPPAGALSMPTVPTNPPSTFSKPIEPPVPMLQPKQESRPADKATPLESKAVELKTPDLKSDIPKGTTTGIGAAPEPLGSAPASRRGAINCPDKAGFKSIRDISYDIRPMASVPQPTECPLITTPYHGRHFSRTCYQWKASALCTKAAYFEDVQLERYGHSICPFLEPVISGARFFVTVPFLPYKMGLTPPTECVYTLGHYRVGNCSPYMLDPLPISVRAVLFEGAAIGAGVALIP